MDARNRCCFLNCGDLAAFVIYGEHPDDYTNACEDHVGALLGTPVGHPDNCRWVVEVFRIAALGEER